MSNAFSKMTGPRPCFGGSSQASATMFRPAEWPPWSREDAERPDWHPFDPATPFVDAKKRPSGKEQKPMDF
jgi:hypothetical protein